MNISSLKKSIRRWLFFFIIMLVLSGITASPIETELQWICAWWPDKNASFYKWLFTCYSAIKNINTQYPFLAYGYDWLAFAHVVIAIAFIGPIQDPVRNIWVINFGRIACLLIIPLALIAGQIRGIPMYWRLLDCSFGIFGLIPLSICYRKIKQLEKLIQVKNNRQSTPINYSYAD